MNELDIETLPVSCLNALKDLPQPDLRYTDPVLFEINAKLDKILRILDKKE